MSMLGGETFCFPISREADPKKNTLEYFSESACSARHKSNFLCGRFFYRLVYFYHRTLGTR